MTTTVEPAAPATPDPPRGDGAPPDRTLVRVLMVHGARRVPLALPAHVPLVDLLDALGAAVAGPGAASEVGGGADAGGAAGLAVATAAGRPLRHDASVAEQGVVDGDLLVLLGREEAGRLPDPRGPGEGADAGDVGATVARLVDAAAQARSTPPARPRLAVAALALTGPAALLAALPRGGPVALGAAACLLALAGVLGRAGSARALVAAVAASVHAGVAGAVLAPADGGGGLRLAVAGSAAAVVAALALPLLRERRLLLLPAVAVGTVLAVAALVAQVVAVPPRAGVLAAAALGVLALPALPRLAVGASGMARRLPDLAAPPVPPVQPDDDAAASARPAVAGAGTLDEEVRAAHDLLVAGHLTSAALLLAAVPVAVPAGPAGAALVLAGVAVLLTTAARWRDPAAAPAAAAGATVLVALVPAALALQPGWRPLVAAALLAAGLALLVAPTAGSAVARARLARARDRVEGAALLAVVPLLALASGGVAAAVAAVEAVLAASGGGT